MADDYSNVKTGQDLVDEGVVPKTSSAHLALVTYKRLLAIRDRILGGINDEMLGQWVPATGVAREPYEGEWLEGAEPIKANARVGMRVCGTRHYDDWQISGLEGTIHVLDDSKGRMGIEFDQSHESGHDLGGLCEKGYGYYVPPSSLKLKVEGGEIITGYRLVEGVVAHAQLGHKVRFTKEYRTMNRSNSRQEIIIPEGTVATLENYDPESGEAMFRFDLPLDGQYEKLGRPLLDFTDSLQASSLGQQEPLEKEAEVRKQTIADFFPKTVLDMGTAEKKIIGILMGKDFVLYGPPGGGKTNSARDIMEIAKQQGTIFVVNGCKVQCNPFSLFDEAFAREVPACPACKIAYDPDFKSTGHFRMQDPKDVKVIPAKYTEGFGIEFTEGTTGLKRMHLTGFKMPKGRQDMVALFAQVIAGMGNLPGDMQQKLMERFCSPDGDGESAYDPAGFEPGVLPRTNNGILLMEELDKLRIDALDNVLEALNDNMVKPDQLRFPYPAHALIIGTANDVTKFSGAFNDRALLLPIEYPEDVDVSYDITRASFHNEILPAEKVDIGDTHKEPPLQIGKIPMPAPLEKAVDAVFIKFRKEFQGAGKNEVSGSNRSKNDALLAARALLFLDDIFQADTPDIVTPRYVLSGINYALCSRVQEMNKDKRVEAQAELCKWLAEAYPPALEGEEKAWWCRVKRDVAIAKTQVPAIEGKFFGEMASYQEDPRNAVNAFKSVKAAKAKGGDPALEMMFERPFIDYLFREQPGFAALEESNQITALIKFFADSFERCEGKKGEVEKDGNR